MPKEPQAKKRPKVSIQAAVKIATGEIAEKLKGPSGKARSPKAEVGARAQAKRPVEAAATPRRSRRYVEKLLDLSKMEPDMSVPADPHGFMSWLDDK